MSVGVTSARMLYTKPQFHRFKAGQHRQFMQALQTIDGCTTTLPPVDVDDLRLNLDGTTVREKLRYTGLGFNQVVQVLASGLSALLPDLAGLELTPEQDPDEFDMAAAVGIFNTVLALRYNRVQRYRLIRNSQGRTIEGLVGPGNPLLDNHTMAQEVDNAVRAGTLALEFLGGELVGRRLTLWYREPQPAFKLMIQREPTPFWRGIYFCNGEATGTSLRGTQAIYTLHGCCLMPMPRSDRVPHAGRNFTQRMGSLFQRVLGQVMPVAELRAHIQRLLQTKLGFAGKEAEREQRQEQLVRALYRRNIAQWIAADVVQYALCVGGDRQAANPHEMLQPGRHALRTEYDLFCALLRRSRKLGGTRREAVEQAAYDLLIKKLKI